jgi:hypothetical protein
MNTSAPPHEGCMAIDELTGLDQAAIHRFVVGDNTGLKTLSQDEAAAELGDPFATLLLLNGVFPRSAAEVLTAIEAATPAGDPLRQTQFFLLGEGSQIPFSTETQALIRNLRFVTAVGGGPAGPDILLSAFNPDDGDVELMAWDHRNDGFNFYRTVGQTRAWVFAGNSSHALTDPTQGNGPFESHRSGAFLMKELRSPWINWHSPDGPVQPSVFAEDDPLRNHPWFIGREPGGALTCERAVARPAITRWAKARFDKLADAGEINDPERVMRQVLDTPAVNLVSSRTEAATAAQVETIDLPPTFFVDSEMLNEVLGLPAPPGLTVPSSIYRKSLETFDVKLTDGGGFTRIGDTHFAFVVPERGFEDREAVREAIRIGLLTERFAAALLMTDFANPTFSARRASLLAHVPDEATVANGESDFSEQMAEAIVNDARSKPADSAEAEFARRWEAGENNQDWKETFGGLLNDYYAALAAALSGQDGWDAVMRLAESRRQHVRDMPINESPLLFAQTNIDGNKARSMRPDGTIEE